MEPHQDPFLFSSLQQLIKELENLVVLETSRQGNPWISVTKLTELFYEKYKVSPQEVAKAQGYSLSLRSLFKSSGSFRVYGTQMPQEFYVAFCNGSSPWLRPESNKNIKYRMKKPWNVDDNLMRMLKAEGAEEIP